MSVKEPLPNPIEAPLDLSVLHSLPQKPGFLDGFAESFLLKALQPMKRGCLTFILPDGTERVFGQDQNTEFQARIQIQNPAFFKKTLFFGHIGFGESYLDGDWETPCLESVIAWFILNIDDSTLLEGSSNKLPLINLMGKLNRFGHLFRSNSLKMSRKNIQEHYDLGNEFFKLFLDPTLTYSSGRFTHSGQTLEQAQIDKYDTLCQKLQLKPTDHLLEIGTGWGGFSLHAARNYGCKIDTVTISQKQFDCASARIAEAGLSSRVTVLLQDYRKISGRYDKIVSIEMLEAVGDAYLDTYFAKCREVLKPGGLLALQYITCPDSRYALLKDNVDFIQKHIFPGSLLPSIGRVNQALNKTGNLFLHDLEDMGNSYAKTLQLWHDAFNAHLDEVRAQGFDERFIRKWNYYLMYCKAAFRMRNISVVQAVYTNPNNLLLWQAL